ncbi:MAG: MXAN_6640 family putative metalloprotease [Myxococcota bacterium]
MRCVGPSSEVLVWLVGVLTLGACGPAEGGFGPEYQHARVRQHELRPDSSDPHLGLGYEGAAAASYATPGGAFRIWWATSGRHAPPLADVQPANGVPDHVEMVGRIADEVSEHALAQGWELALSDDQIAVPFATGGDGRFDIYLIDFGGGSDGLLARNGCAVIDGVEACTAHILIENDFAGYAYPSLEEAVRVLVSHEYFHAIQAAYTQELEPWASEGTATWFEEDYYPAQSDFERLANRFFQDNERSLNARSQGPFDGFTYGASIFFRYLDLQWGPETIRLMFEGMRGGADVYSAIDAAIRERGGEGLEDAFMGFAAQNGFTGSRARTDTGYPAADRYADVRRAEYDASGGLNWDVSLEPWTAQYALLEVSGPVTLALEDAPESARVLALTGPQDYVSIAPGAPVGVEGRSGVLYVAVVNPDPSADAFFRVAVRNDDGVRIGDGHGGLEPSDGSGGGCTQTPRGTPRAPSWLVLAFLGLAALRRRGPATHRDTIGGPP